MSVRRPSAAIRDAAVDRQAGWWPGLDGLRGVAVLAVLVYHHDAERLPGGFLGVSLFFTLSGFLLTTLVLREHARSDTISLRRFWVRRLRRLVPVALIGLGVALLVTFVTVEAARIGQTVDDIRFAALDVANWRFALRSVTYGDTLAAPSPVLHYWSLAIEEQFYVVFPIVAAVALRRGRRLFAATLLFVVAASLARQLSLDDVNRIYLGTDTRAAELAIGGLAAIGWDAQGHRMRRAMLDVFGVVAAIVVGLIWLTVGLDTTRLWHGGIVGYAVLSCVLIVAAVGGRTFTGLLSCAPLRALGGVSYGVYALHFPLFLLLTGDRLGFSGASLFVVRVVATIAVAALVHWLVEAPVRWRGALPGRQGLLAMATAVAAVLIVATGLSSIQHGVSREEAAHTTVSTMILSGTAGPSEPAASPAGNAGGVAAAASRTAEATGHPAGESGAADDGGDPAAGPPPPRLLVVGDSTAQANGSGMQRWGTATQAAEIDVVAQLGCTLLLTGQARLRNGWVTPPTAPCFNLLDDIVRAAEQLKPDAIVVFIGSLQLADWQLPGDAQFRGLGDPMLDAPYAAAADAAMARLEAVGVPVLFADVATPAWDPSKSGTGNFPGSGPVTINDAERTRTLNAIDASVIARHPATRSIAYASHLERADGTIDPAMRPDGLHLTPAAAADMMNAWLLEELVAGYRDVTTSLPATLARPTTWTAT